MANFNLPAVPTTPEGGLAGFFRGTQYNYGLADLERQFRDSDLQNLRNQNMYENEVLDNPNKAANRATDLLKQTEEQEQYTSGLKRKGAVADVNKKEADVTHTQLQNKQLEITQAADALNEFVQVAKAQPMSIMNGWDGYMTELAKKGVKVPEGGYSQQNMDILQARALAAQNSLAQLRAMELNNQKFGQDTAIHQMDNAARERVARIQAAAQVNSANAMRPPNPTNEAYALADREFAATGKVSFDTLQRVGDWTIKNDDTLRPKLVQAEIDTLTKSELYKNKAISPLELKRLAEVTVDNQLAANKLKSAYFSTGSKPVSREDLTKIEKIDPSLAKYIKENGKVVGGGGEQPQVSTTQKSSSGLDVDQQKTFAILRQNPKNAGISDQALIEAVKARTVSAPKQEEEVSTEPLPPIINE